MRRRAGAALVGLICSAGVLGWQSLTVRYNYQGNWSALFCTGSYVEAPPLEEFGGTYLFRGSFGYDGQFYRYMAHDPFLKRGLWKQVDAPRIRYRRILVPGLAYAGGLGRPRAIDAAYLAVTLGFVFLGGYWASRYAVARGRHPAWGLAFVLTPAALVSADRMVVDAALAALCCGWALYWGEERAPRVARYAVLVAAPLARETGLLLNLASGIPLALRRQGRELALWAAAILPCAGWYAFVAARTQPWAGDWGSYVAYVPLEGFLRRLLHPSVYPPGMQLRGFFIALDYVSLAGMALALALGIRLWLRRRDGAIEVAVLLFSLLAIQTGSGDVWADAFAFGRVFSPLLLLLALKGLETGRSVLALPLALVTLRVGAQFGGQAIGVLRGL
ncbi:MAG: hypothetical protein ABSH05_15280 [Bryobacteraceae bacterium]